ncbi:MAG: sulfurtransferase [Firmicutes bacterium]|nr:sulfurtransferase [Bacillota bacterium]
MSEYVIIAIVIIILVWVIGRRILIMMNPNVKNISADEARSLLSENKDVIILDVRTKEEYVRGHIPKALLLPVHELAIRINELEKYVNTPILVYCASGGRSPGAVNTLLRNKFTAIYHLNRGISTWKFDLEK